MAGMALMQLAGGRGLASWLAGRLAERRRTSGRGRANWLAHLQEARQASVQRRRMRQHRVEPHWLGDGTARDQLLDARHEIGSDGARAQMRLGHYAHRIAERLVHPPLAHGFAHRCPYRATRKTRKSFLQKRTKGSAHHVALSLTVM
jgi:hypothetical protein